MKIGTKLNLLLTLVFVSGILISGAILSNVLEQRAEDEVASQALRGASHFCKKLKWQADH